MNTLAYPQHIACPQCGVLVACCGDKRPKSFPFCKQRCRVVDLGAWSDESHSIDGDDMVYPWDNEI